MNSDVVRSDHGRTFSGVATSSSSPKNAEIGQDTFSPGGQSYFEIALSPRSVGKMLAASPLPPKTLGLVHLRASQINGCAVCVDMEITKTTETPAAKETAAKEKPADKSAEKSSGAGARKATAGKSSPRGGRQKKKLTKIKRRG